LQKIETTKRIISKRNRIKQKNHTRRPKQRPALFGPSALHSFVGGAFGAGGVHVLMVVVDAWELESWESFVVVGVIWQWCHFSFFSGAHDHMVCAQPQGI
jgi:hypothetical protein